MSDDPAISASAPARIRRTRPAVLHDGGFPYSTLVTAGPLMFTAGISPLDPTGTVLDPGNVVAQTHHCLDNLRAVLDDAGAGFADVAKLTVYVAEHLQADLVVAWDAVRDEFGADLPAAMMMGVTVLPYDGQVVELDAVAAPRT